MNKNIIIALIAVVLLGTGVYFYTNSQRGTSDQNNPAGHGSISGGHGAVNLGTKTYEVEVLSNSTNLAPNKQIQFRYRIKDEKGETLKNYAIAHEKIMHFIAVRKDLQYFQHLHPNYQDATGEFSVNVTFPTDGPYSLFPDFTPGINNPEKAPVTVYHDLNIGDLSKYKAQTVEVDSEAKKTFGEYQITYTFPSNVTKGEDINFSLNIARNGQSMTNLEPYLGALGHSVILKENTLDFIHTHAEELSSKGPYIKFATTFPESGNYKIFTQFQHQRKVFTTYYVIKVN